MSIVVTRRAILILAVIACVATLVVAGIGYGTALSVANDAPTVKVQAERVLFVGIIAVIVVVAAAATVVLHALWISARLEKLVEMSRISGFPATAALTRLGEIGNRIAALYAPLADVSNMKSRKISALSALVEALIDATPEPVLVVDATGMISHAGREMLEESGTSRTNVVGLYLDTVIPNAGTAAALREMRTAHVPAQQERKDRPSLKFTPILNSAGELTYALVMLSPADMKDLRTAAQTAQPPRRERPTTLRAGLMSRLFGSASRRPASRTDSPE